MKRITIKDVAKQAGVSYSTVSRALSGSANVSPDAYQRIIAACKDMNYTVNTVARAMVIKSTKLLGLILPGVNNPYMSELAYHIDRQARNMGYNIILCNSAYDPQQENSLFELMVGRQVDGIILVPVGPESYDNLCERIAQVPTVFVGENMRDAPENYVSVDNFRGAYMGVEYLYSLGHRRILYFGQRKASITHQLRAEGYAAACKDLGLNPQYCNNTFTSSSTKYGYLLAKQMFSQPRNYTAVFASTDTNAFGVMQAAEEVGLRIPEDLSLLGFDNIRDSSLPRINLSTIEQPVKMLASVCVNILVDKIQNNLDGYTHRILMPSLMKRSTCAPLAGYPKPDQPSNP